MKKELDVLAAHFITQYMKQTGVHRSGLNKVHSFYRRVKNRLQLIRHLLYSKRLSMDAAECACHPRCHLANPACYSTVASTHCPGSVCADTDTLFPINPMFLDKRVQ
eukprot:TRINITY_DN21903_c0_g1_i1.p1 TRINITY_DN21903_c0_g1~~TRINITY_DN21903_c0_g1_i1.p1  ORF type:complete len:107 (-),score=0.36 TRINITY_DN21903_c0_g1_i1:336-656(-)